MPGVNPVAFAAAVDDLRLPNFSGAEAVACMGGRAGRGSRRVSNELPPPWGAARLLVVLRYAQELRDAYGGPLWLNSLYRSPDYNRAVRGARLSQHKAAAAVDLGCSDPGRLAGIARKMRGHRIPFTDEQWAVITRYMARYDLPASSLFSSSVSGIPFDPRGLSLDREGFTAMGGIGRYRTFVHVDLRGVAVSWNG